MREMKAYRILVRKYNENVHMEYQESGRMMLRWILVCEDWNWMGQAQDHAQ
jgi:hypothetical protein